MNTFIDEEKEANLFALELLMPESLLRAEMAKFKGGIDITEDKDVKVLAKKFGVTQTMMAFRLGQISNI